MTETEKLQQKIAELESECGALNADLTQLSSDLASAEAAAAAAIAVAERSNGEPGAEMNAERSEGARVRVEALRRRKQAALAAALDDLHAARAALVASRRAADLITLQTTLDHIQLAASELDADVTNLQAWSELHDLTQSANSAYYNAGGKARLLPQPKDIRGRLFSAYASQIDSMFNIQRGSIVPVPKMYDLAELARARGLVRELMTGG